MMRPMAGATRTEQRRRRRPSSPHFAPQVTRIWLHTLYMCYRLLVSRRQELNTSFYDTMLGRLLAPGLRVRATMFRINRRTVMTLEDHKVRAACLWSRVRLTGLSCSTPHTPQLVARDVTVRSNLTTISVWSSALPCHGRLEGKATARTRSSSLPWVMPVSRTCLTVGAR